jgi:hypothetical protein
MRMAVAAYVLGDFHPESPPGISTTTRDANLSLKPGATNDVVPWAMPDLFFDVVDTMVMKEGSDLG